MSLLVLRRFVIRLESLDVWVRPARLIRILSHPRSAAKEASWRSRHQEITRLNATGIHALHKCERNVVPETAQGADQ